MTDFKKAWEEFEKPLLNWRWKIMRYGGGKTSGLVIAYFDARDAEKRFDECFGLGGWQDSYYEASGLLFCKIGVKVEDGWIWKSGVGVEKEVKRADQKDMIVKGQASEAFKLAATKWGAFGRKAYSEESFWIKVKPFGNNNYPVDGNGERIWDLTKFVNYQINAGIAKNSISKMSQSNRPPKPKKTTEEIKKSELNSTGEILFSKEKAITKIKKYFDKKYLSNKSKTSLMEYANKASFQTDFFLIDEKLNLIELLMTNRSYMEDFTAKTLFKRVMGCSLETSPDLMKEIDNYRK